MKSIFPSLTCFPKQYKVGIQLFLSHTSWSTGLLRAKNLLSALKGLFHEGHCGFQLEITLSLCIMVVKMIHVMSRPGGHECPRMCVEDEGIWHGSGLMDRTEYGKQSRCWTISCKIIWFFCALHTQKWDQQCFRNMFYRSFLQMSTVFALSNFIASWTYPAFELWRITERTSPGSLKNDSMSLKITLGLSR